MTGTAQTSQARSLRAASGLLLLDAIGLLPFSKQGEDDPLDRGEFTRRFVELAGLLRSAFRPHEARALTRIAEVVDVDWPTLGAGERARVLRRAAALIRDLPRRPRDRVLERVEAAALRMERRAREAARREFDLQVPRRLPRDQAARAMRLAAPTPDFIRDEYERRSNRFAEIAAVGIAAALAADRPAADIVSRVAAIAREHVERPDYFDGVGASVLNRARTHSMLTAFDEVGIATFEVRAVLDARTCVKCRFMHGTTFTITQGLRTLNRVAAARTPQAVTRLNPFLRQGRNAAGQQVIYIAGPGGRRRVVARVVQSGEGQADVRGRFADMWDSGRLARAGIGAPPYHPICRCVVVPA